MISYTIAGVQMRKQSGLGLSNFMAFCLSVSEEMICDMLIIFILSFTLSFN